MWRTWTELYTHLWQDESVTWSIPWIRHWKCMSLSKILNDNLLMISHQNVWRNCKLTYYQYLHSDNQPLLMTRQNKPVHVAMIATLWRASVISYQLLIFNKLLTVKLQGAMPLNPFRRVILKGGPTHF